jgi:hypothetical protein
MTFATVESFVLSKEAAAKRIHPAAQYIIIIIVIYIDVSPPSQGPS